MTAAKPPVVLIGAGMHGRVTRDICRDAGLTVLGFLDDFLEPGSAVDDVKNLGPIADFTKSHLLDLCHFVVTIGNNIARCRIASMIESAGGTLAIVAHPNVVISPTATVGAGTVFIGANMVFSRATLGKNILVDPDVTIGAESIIEDGAYLCPGVHLGAATRIGKNAFIGLGAVVIPNVRIGENSIIGAGAVVTRDIPDGKLAVGSPAIVKGDAVLDDFSPYPARRRD